IRTIPSLQHDPDRPEDLDTGGEDHAADEWRYACLSRPWVRPTAPPPRPQKVFCTGPGCTVTLDDLWEAEARKRRRHLERRPLFRLILRSARQRASRRMGGPGVATLWHRRGLALRDARFAGSSG